MSYAHSGEAVADITASPDLLFEYLDDQASLG